MTADTFDTLVAAHARKATGVESALPRPALLAPGYLRLIARIEALAGNASGTDKSWGPPCPCGRGAALQGGEATLMPLEGKG